MSSAKNITLSSSIPTYNSLLDHLENIIHNNNGNFFPELVNAARSGYNKLKVYYAKTDESHMYPIATSNM